MLFRADIRRVVKYSAIWRIFHFLFQLFPSTHSYFPEPFLLSYIFVPFGLLLSPLSALMSRGCLLPHAPLHWETQRLSAWQDRGQWSWTRGASYAEILSEIDGGQSREKASHSCQKSVSSPSGPSVTEMAVRLHEVSLWAAERGEGCCTLIATCTGLGIRYFWAACFISSEQDRRAQTFMTSPETSIWMELFWLFASTVSVLACEYGDGKCEIV